MTVDETRSPNITQNHIKLHVQIFMCSTFVIKAIINPNIYQNTAYLTIGRNMAIILVSEK